MSSELPPPVVRAIAFVGRGGGLVKTLSGFRKSAHNVPDAANATTNAFLAKICAPELTEDAERLFQAIRTGLGYKRKDLALTLSTATANLAGKDFAVEIAYALSESRPAEYTVTTTLRDLADLDLARGEAFRAIFRGRFGELEFLLRQRARVEAVIDAIESLPSDTPISVNYPSNCEHCDLRVAGVDATVRCTTGALNVIFARAGSPAELIDGFSAIREAFQINQVLNQLIVV